MKNYTFKGPVMKNLKNLKKYKLTEEEYFDLLESCQNRCMICNRPPTGNKALAVEHNHKTGQVRGICCFLCNNKLLSNMADREDSVELFRKAADYLEKYRNGKKIKDKKKLDEIFKFSSKSG